jgi:3-hydroxyacyl-[acyl-carrier-protein] dehydratase
VSATLERVLLPDHPASRGHFEGNPIIPGAVLLSEAVQAIAPAARLPLLVTSAKFLHPARPGDRVVIEYNSDGKGQVRFACTVDGRSVLTGQMSCSAPPTAR